MTFPDAIEAKAHLEVYRDDAIRHMEMAMKAPPGQVGLELKAMRLRLWAMCTEKVREAQAYLDNMEDAA